MLCHNNLDQQFELKKELVFHGKVYREACLERSEFVNFESWARQQRFYEHLVNGDANEQKMFADHCKLIHQCTCVYDEWETIVRNLTDKRMVK